MLLEFGSILCKLAGLEHVHGVADVLRLEAISLHLGGNVVFAKLRDGDAELVAEVTPQCRERLGVEPVAVVALHVLSCCLEPTLSELACPALAHEA